MDPSLSDLPPRALATLFALDAGLLPLWLSRLGSRKLHQAARALAYDTLVIHDADDEPGAQLATVLHGPAHYAHAVSSIRLLPPARHAPRHDEDSVLGDDQSATASSSSSPPTTRTAPHRHACSAAEYDLAVERTDRTLALLLARVPNLKHFQWLSDRLPARDLCTVLGTHCPNLERFILDISHPNDPFHASTGPWMAGHDHGLLENPWTRQRSLTAPPIEDGDSDSDSGLIHSNKPIRWDADGVDSLPMGLNLLHISSLSSIGSKRLARAFEAMTWIGLIELKLNNTLFVDDELMSSIVLGSKKIRNVRIESMSGTKLTEKGIEVLFNCLDGLEEMEIIDVEGRFSKSGWLKLDDLPHSLKSLKFGYYEIGSYHSWTLEHLNNILSLLSLYPKQLQTLSIKRFSPYPALVPGRHSTFSELSIGNRTSPKKMTKEQIMGIVEDGTELRVLEIDWWVISIEGLEVIVKGLPELVKLRVLVDAPFHRIIGSAAFVHSKIRTLVVSIPPEHTPSLTNLVSPTTSTTTTNGSPITGLKSIPTSPELPTYHHQSSPPLPTPNTNIVSPVPVRDIKKFIKRAGHLREIVWTGRGGLGNYKFTRTCGSAVNVKVEFVPITEYLPLEVFGYESSNSLGGGGSGGRRNSLVSGSGHSISSGHHHYQHKGPSSSSTKRRTSSIPHQQHTREEESRRSSEASLQSLSTSWGSNSFLHHHHKKLVNCLEGIPGTPVCGDEDEVVCLEKKENKDEEEMLLIEKQINHLDLAFA